MVVIPLVFSALTLGVARIGDTHRLGRVGVRTLLMTVALSLTSVAIGITLANTIGPGTRLSEEKRLELRERYTQGPIAALDQAKRAKTLRDSLLDIIPKKPLQEMVGALDGSSPGGGMLAVMFFSLVVGAAIARTPEKGGPLIVVLERVYDVCMTIIGWAMRLAPLGVAGLVFSLTAVLGYEILTTMAFYVTTVLLGLFFHMFGTYSLVTSVFARISPRRFFSRIGEIRSLRADHGGSHVRSGRNRNGGRTRWIAPTRSDSPPARGRAAGRARHHLGRGPASRHVSHDSQRHRGCGGRRLRRSSGASQRRRGRLTREGTD
jgi:DAACS family dicarboxylate/amino acid:cation (Na+ or H+) symporter